MDRKWWTLIAVCVGTFMLLLDVTIVNVALPAIQTSLKASFSDLQWVVDAYALMLAALLLTTGSLADLFGRRRVFMIGLVIFSLSSLLSGTAASPLWLNLARGAQGIGGAAMFSTSLALLGSAFQGRERGTAFGAWGAITGLAVAIGPVLGGALVTGLSWRWIFLVNVPIGVIALILCWLRVEESKQPGARRPDVVGVITFSGALGALIFALIKGNSVGWGSTEILACLIGAGVLLIAFVVAELIQRDQAMFELSLFRKPTFTGGAIAAFALSAGLFSLLLYLTLYLQDVLHFSAFDTGLRLLVLSGGILLTSTLAGRLTATVPIRLLIAPGLAMVGVGLLLMRGLDAGSQWSHLVPGFIVAGAGTGLINPPLASTAIGVVTPERAGMASGINATFRQVGIATGIAGFGSLFSHTVRTRIVSLLNGAPHITASQSHSLAIGVAQGSGVGSGLAHLSAQARPAAAHAIRSGFVAGLNDVFLVGAILVFVAAGLTLVLIRSRDFEASAARGGAPPARETQPTTAVAADPAGEVGDERAVETADDHPAKTAVDHPAEAADERAVETADERAVETADDHPAAPVANRASAAPAVSSDGATSATAATSQPATGGAEIELAHSAEVVVRASEQAIRDYASQIESEIERHRSEQVHAAEEQARELIRAALARSEDYAARLRERERGLAQERERLVGELLEHVHLATQFADRAALARAELYRVIGALGDFHPDEPQGDGSNGAFEHLPDQSVSR